MKKRLLFCFIITITIVSANFCLKSIARGIYGKFDLWGILQFKFARNYGMTFGLFENQKLTIATVEFILLSIALFLLFRVVKNSRKFYYISPILFILSGGTGNVADRIFHGYVTDYVRFNINGFTYFNLDDVFIIIGVAIFTFQILFNNKAIGKIYS